MMIRYVLAFFFAAIWSAGVALVVFAVLGAIFDRQCRQSDVRSSQGSRRADGKPRTP